MSATLDFQQILQSPTATYEEGLRFFRGEGLVNQTLKQLAADLDARGIAYAVIGAVALNQHGFQRFTSDIDILLTKEGLARFNAELVGRGYQPHPKKVKRASRTRFEKGARMKLANFVGFRFLVSLMIIPPLPWLEARIGTSG